MTSVYEQLDAIIESETDPAARRALAAEIKEQTRTLFINYCTRYYKLIVAEKDTCPK